MIDNPQAATSKRYTLADVTILAFPELDVAQMEAFEALVLRLLPEPDDENGPDTWKWVLDQQKTFPVDGPYKTFLFLDKKTGAILATISFVPDDRNCLADAGITAFGVIGFFNILVRGLRGAGLGGIIATFLDQYIEEQAVATGSAQPVYLFSATPGYYADYGFTESGLPPVDFLGHPEPLCIKTYGTTTGGDTA